MPQGIYERKYGKENPNWKGDNICYSRLHHWIKRELGEPQFCVDCGTTTAKRFEWANISGKYKRDINDFKRLCVKCHRKFDRHFYPRGEENSESKLKEKDVIIIKEMYKTNEYSHRELGKIFHVNHATIGKVIRKETWKHI